MVFMLLSFVDDAYMNLFNGELLVNLGGMLVVGGGAIVVMQMGILIFGSRLNDKFIIAFTKEQLSSVANKVFINQMVKPEYNNWLGKDTYEERFLRVIELYFDSFN